MVVFVAGLSIGVACAVVACCGVTAQVPCALEMQSLETLPKFGWVVRRACRGARSKAWELRVVLVTRDTEQVLEWLPPATSIATYIGS